MKAGGKRKEKRVKGKMEDIETKERRREVELRS